MDILLSIIIPVYNRQTGIENLLTSLVQSSDYHSYKESIEVIVIDDASTVAIALPILPILPITHVNIERHLKNSGAPRSRERGFKRSQGSFVHFHDSDDTFSAEWLSGVMSAISDNKNIDLLLTARHDIAKDNSECYRVQNFFHQNTNHINKVKKRLLYRNCLGPLGGVTFSRRVLQQISFRNLASCQDWQMYLEAIQYAKVLVSCPDITYNFFIAGDDRISHNSLKKILGFLQLSKVTAKQSIFGKHIRFFYLYTCRMHILKKKGFIKTFYHKRRFIIFIYFILITLYWRLF